MKIIRFLNFYLKKTYVFLLTKYVQKRELNLLNLYEFMINEELCLACVEKFPNHLDFIPVKFRSKKIYETAVKKDPFLVILKDRYPTDLYLDLWLLALTECPELFNDISLEFKMPSPQDTIKHLSEQVVVRDNKKRLQEKIRSL